jgi:protein-disulfide isomerase
MRGELQKPGSCFRSSSALAGLLFLAGLMLSHSALAQAMPGETPIEEPKKELPTDLPQDIALGSPDAPVTMIEYTSLTCPHCADFNTRILPEIEETYVKTGKIKIIHRDYPLNAPALHGAMLTHCVNRDNYYDMLKLLFREQEKWAFSENYKEKLAAYASLSGLSQEKFESCLNDKELENRVLNSRIYATNAYDIKGTPAFIINGEIADVRALFLSTEAYLSDIVREAEAAKAANKTATPPADSNNSAEKKAE